MPFTFSVLILVIVILLGLLLSPVEKKTTDVPNAHGWVFFQVTQCHGAMTTERRGRVTVDRDTISYDKLRRHLIKLFRLKS